MKLHAVSRSSLIHLRLPFSWLLLPIFLFGLLAAPGFDFVKATLVFAVLHFFIYTASNSFNTYFDRDADSIGLIKRPPAVTSDLLWISLSFDIVGVLLACVVSWQFALGCLIYGAASKAYSLPQIRIKKYPIAGWLFTGTGQGTLTFLLIVFSVKPFPLHMVMNFNIWFPALCIGLLLLGLYPLTQVYQHAEDKSRGDQTISLLLGVKGTFILSTIFLSISIIGILYYLCISFGQGVAISFATTVIPIVIYFAYWFSLIVKDETKADYEHTMRMCLLASTLLNLFCVGVLIIYNR